MSRQPCSTTLGDFSPSWLLALATAAGLLIPAAAPAAEPAGGAEPAVPVPDGVEYLPDLVYGQAAGVDLKLDLARPKGLAGPRPVVVYFHGGGWVRGDRKSCLPELFRTAQAGYVAVTVGHRFAPEHPFPAQIDDARRALDWLRNHALRYGINPGRVGVIGYCSGGTLACLLGADGPQAGVRAVVGYYPVTDLARWHKSAAGLALFEGLAVRYSLLKAFGGDPQQFPGEYASASPVGHVGPNSAPTLLIHGADDGLVPHEQSELYRDALKSCGVEVRLWTLKGVGHCFDADPARGAEAEALARAFLDRHLKRPAVAAR
jgi:acetyl esterase/lipase